MQIDVAFRGILRQSEGMSEPRVTNLISVAEAIQIIDNAAIVLRTRRMPLSEAKGLRLAKALTADRDFPPFDKSLMDGFAVRCADARSAPVELRCVGEIAAGSKADRPLQPGETMAIMTGAPLPAGADAVVPVEFTQRIGESRVKILEPARPGRFITPRGGDCVRGATVLESGALLGAAQIGVAAAVGAHEPDVFIPPSIGILGTGDEIVLIDASPGESQIRNSNNPMLAALLRSLGFASQDLGIAKDDPKLIREAFERAGRCDVLLISGGMSMGQYDHVPKILSELGYDLRITKLRIKPGKPFVFAVRDEKDGRPSFAFGLPGNPLSAFCCTLRLVSRLLTRMSGGTVEERFLRVKLGKDLPANGPREFYQPAILCDDVVNPLGWKGSADLFTLAQANVLLVREENEPAKQAGDPVRVLEIPR